MLQHVDVGERSLKAYQGVAPQSILNELVELAERVRGARVLQLNATPYGGGVSELLRSIVPLMNDLGLVTDWKIIGGEEAFFDATKQMHNALQGDPSGLTETQTAVYLEHAERNAREMADEAYDVVVVHDPQPAALLSFRDKGDTRWIWRCHIDTSEPNPDTWRFLREHLAGYDAAVFTMDAFVPPDFPLAQVSVIPPAIDPLSAKNLSLPDTLVRELLAWIGIALDRPLVTQVSRFDPWKDPLGVIEAYRMAREEVDNLQLALVGSMALDDPEGWDVYREIQDHAENDPLIHLFTNLNGVGNTEVNAFQRHSDVVVQKSIREGFGLVVSEAMWKGTPVVAGRAGGIPLQMADGVGGILVDSVEECAAGITRLLTTPDEAARLGNAGRERVRERFLLPRLLLDEIRLVAELVDQG
jgi:trehalose synthase